MVSILLVEDEKLERDGIKKIITGNGQFRVVGEAADGKQAIQAIRELDPDIVLLDIMLPEVDGLQVMRHCRRLLTDAELIIITAYDQFGYASEALSAGASDYLLKPVSPDRLMTALMRARNRLERKRELKVEQQHLDRLLASSEPILRQVFVQELISGSVDVKEAEMRAGFLGMKALPQLVMVINIDQLGRLGRDDVRDQQVYKLKVEQMCSRVLSAQCNEWLLSAVQGGNLAALLSNESVDGDLLAVAIDIGKQIVDVAYDEIGLSVTVGVSDVHSCDDIEAAFGQAVSAERYKHVIGGNRVIAYKDVAELGGKGYPLSKERYVADLIKTGNVSDVDRAAGELWEQLVMRTEPGEIVHCVLEMVIVLSRAACEGIASTKKVMELKMELVRELVQHGTADMARHVLMRSAREFARLNVVQGDGVSVVEAARSYIDANCHRDLNLREVARRFHLNPSYLSRLFKRQVGVTFVEYITTLRVERAKELLETTDMDMKDIAKATGFHSQNYFSLVFKKIVGMPPTGYRQSIEKDEQGVNGTAR